ncbi:hypothetical protein Syun_016797 [Stephania yunnanensis]|uniref:Carbohydrate kinase PfkB domain-containing protein n=1 Tax=Stephania yunnanensis TaxID=152371 RepID=A0AAP0J6P5_9MAGN
MGREGSDAQIDQRGLVVGNYCHDVLIKDGQVIGESLGGASSFVFNVFDGLSVSCDYVSKVGSDFAYSVPHRPLSSPSSPTTLFYAHLTSPDGVDGDSGAQDRVLKRVRACEAIEPSDLPDSRFDFGLAVGVAGEIRPETLERMIELCGVVFVDVQALIRVFDSVDGSVRLVGLRESGFFHLIPRIGFLKTSAEEAPFVDVEEARKVCCVIVTDGKDGCRVYWRDGELQISPFASVQIDPTGAGDSFLGGFVAGLMSGLVVPDAALLGNLFGSLTVSQIGIPKFNSKLMERVKDVSRGRKMHCHRRDAGSQFNKSVGHEEFHTSLSLAAKCLSTFDGEEDEWDSKKSPDQGAPQSICHESNGL